MKSFDIITETDARDWHALPHDGRDYRVGCSAEEVFVSSTGVIGMKLPVEKIEATLPALAAALDPGGAERALHAVGAIVWGVSPDDQASKAAFRDKFSLNFPILADLDHRVADAYGVWGERTVGDRTFTGTHRVTFLVDPRGRIARVWGSVTPTGHAAEVLAEIEAHRG